MLHSLIHLGNVLVLASFLVRDILWLRLLSILAGLSFVGFFTFGPSPAREPVAWNVVFIALNVVQIAMLLRERRPVVLTDDEEKLHRVVFRGLARRACRRLFRAGRWLTLDAGDVLVAQGEALARLVVLASGTLRVEAEGRTLAELHEGRLVGEMCFVSGGVTSARVVANEPTRVLEWDSAKLRELLDRDPALREGFTAVIGRDLVHKLRSSSQPTSRTSLPHE